LEEQGDQVVMSDKKERIDQILTQDVTDNKDSEKLNSLLYRDKKGKKIKEPEEESHQKTSMLSFMWGNGKKSKKKSSATRTLRVENLLKKEEKTTINRPLPPKNLLRQEEKTTIRETADAVEISKAGISLKLSESDEGKLKLKISTGKRKDISKKRLAKIAMNAIIKELKKEE
jgi:hypothetical protein